MIGYLRGAAQVTDEETALIVVGGVGYEVACTPSTLAAIDGQGDAALWIYTQVREDALQLFGFAQKREKQLFLQLIKVNGIGPKSALHILSASSVEQIVELISLGDAKGLSQLPKVGKKTAEQIILTLKGKLVFADEAKKAGRPTVRQDVISALVHLGFRLSDVEKVVEKLNPDADLETGVREGLIALTT